MNFLRKFFSRKTIPIEVIKGLQVGDIVFLEYKHPKDIGILNEGGLTFTRLNKQELENRKVRGTISFIRKEGTSQNPDFIEVATYESPAMPGQLRKFLFLSEEIKNIRKVQ